MHYIYITKIENKFDKKKPTEGFLLKYFEKVSVKLPLNTDFTVTYTVDGIDYAMTAAKPTKGYMGLSLDLSSASSN